ncbi:MAG: hypothetical protein U0L98_06685, partial [Clostridia bacterium]|nr:hypothetical protein [Clostridia bacterium]
LLAILIISLGILIFSQAQDTVGSVNMSEQEMMAFNNKFTAYEGTNKRGTEVNALIQAVIANNQAAIANGFNDRVVTIETDSTVTGSSVVITNTETTSSDFGLVEGNVTKGDTYKVSISYNNGIVNEITISK